MDLMFLLYLIFASSPVLSNGQEYPNTVLEMDRARSAWNFGGGGHMRNRQWIRPRNVPGAGAIIANRRIGSPGGSSWVMPSTSPNSRLSVPPKQIRSRQSKPYQKINRPKQKPMKMSKYHHNSSFSSSVAKQPFMPYARPTIMNRKSSALPKTMSSLRNRGSRMMESRSDNILNRFKKEDLWHLDKGEGYQLKNEDLLMDTVMRNPSYFENDNELHEDFHEPSINGNDFQNDMGHNFHESQDEKTSLEEGAEKLINEAEMAGHKFHEVSEGHKSNHVHHHHHYSDHKNVTEPKAKESKKKEDPNKVIPAPLPRVHIPIPLGCLLAVPVFHPIRPRHHLTCLLSIPGTPNMMKRRRKRSTEQQPSTPAQPFMNYFQLLDLNKRMSSPNGIRKHFSNPLGSSKDILPVNFSNLKVPATIIAPPQFDKSDVLDMLLGSGGVNPKEIGTVLATNSRYVRYGRGLPSRSMRGGRALPWSSDSSVNNVRNPNNFKVSNSLSLSANNRNPSSPVTNNATRVQQQPPSNQQALKAAHPVQSPTITIRTSSLSPTPSLSINQQLRPSVNPTPTAPVIVNVQITPSVQSPSRAPPPGPVLTLSASQLQPQVQEPIPQQQVSQQQPYIQEQMDQQPYPPQQTVEQPQDQQIYQTSYFKPSKKASKKEQLKYADFWAPVAKEQAEPLKTYNYEYNQNNDLMDTSESNIYVTKVKSVNPPAKKSKKKSKYQTKYYDDSNSYIKKENNDYYYPPSEIPISSQTKPDFYNNAATSSIKNEQDLNVLLNNYNGNRGENAYDFLDLNSNVNSMVKKNNDNIATINYDKPTKDNIGKSSYSYAVRKESQDKFNYNPVDDNSFSFDSSTLGTFNNNDYVSEGGSLPSARTLLSNYPYSPYSGYKVEDDNDVESSRSHETKYYMVKKVQIPDPIYINVPKESINEVK